MKMFGVIFRNLIGMPLKSEHLNYKIQVYKKIISEKEFIEKRALRELENMPQWQLSMLKKEQLNNLLKNKNILKDNWIKMNKEIENELNQMISDYIDDQGSDTIYGAIREGLNNLKNKNINLLNNMKFDCWEEIVVSSELAELTILQIINSEDYIISTKGDNAIRNYQVQKYLRKQRGGD